MIIEHVRLGKEESGKKILSEIPSSKVNRQIEQLVKSTVKPSCLNSVTRSEGRRG